ncbi:hypothetical protein NHQ30_005584 [Ciborinia camelliae]|nr:hypothetical protein NHQ30_005584 [Ciborinia camelliae]
MKRLRASFSGKGPKRSKLLDSPTIRDDTIPLERPFMLDSADIEELFVNESNESNQCNKKVQEEESALFPEFSQSAIDQQADGADDDNENIDYSTEDSSDSVDDTHHEILGGIFKAKRKGKGKGRWKGKGKEIVREQKSIEPSDELMKGEAKRGKYEAVPKNSGNEKNADNNDSDLHKDAKREGGGWQRVKKMCHLKEKENREIEERESFQFPAFSQSSADSVREIDDDNIKSKEGGSWYNKRSPFSLFASGKPKKKDDDEVFPNYDPTASGNAPGEKVSKYRQNMKSFSENDVRLGKIERWRAGRRGSKLMKRKKAYSDTALMSGGGSGTKMWDYEPMSANGPQISMTATRVLGNAQNSSTSGATNDSGPNFKTNIWNSGKDGQIIDSEPATDTINIINTMSKAPSERRRASFPETVLRKVVSLPAIIKRKLSWRQNQAEVKKSEELRDMKKNGEVIRGREKALGGMIAKKPMNIGEIARTSRMNGTKNLEAQVKEITGPAANVHITSITRSNTVRSVVPVIGDYSNRAGRVEIARERVYGLNKTALSSRPKPEDATKVSPRPGGIFERSYQPKTSRIPSIQETVHSQSDSSFKLRSSQVFERSYQPKTSRIPSIQETVHSQSNSSFKLQSSQVFERSYQPKTSRIPSIQETIHPQGDTSGIVQLRSGLNMTEDIKTPT